MITIDNSVPDSEKCELFGPYGKVGDIENIYGFYRARAEICEKRLSGYWILWKDSNGIPHEMNIEENGRIRGWADGFSDFVEIYLSKIILGDEF